MLRVGNRVLLPTCLLKTDVQSQIFSPLFEDPNWRKRFQISELELLFLCENYVLFFNRQ